MRLFIVTNIRARTVVRILVYISMETVKRISDYQDGLECAPPCYYHFHVLILSIDIIQYCNQK